MRALVFTGPGTLGPLDVPEPVPGPDDVVVRVRSAGICGSEDWDAAALIEPAANAEARNR
jgi:threonine dehydrogenase-like Zn-dependent dehydrogenase